MCVCLFCVQLACRVDFELLLLNCKSLLSLGEGLSGCTCNAGFVIKLKILYYMCLVLFLSFTVYLSLLFSVTFVCELQIFPCCMVFHNIFQAGTVFMLLCVNLYW